VTGDLRWGAFVPQGWKLEYTGWSAADAWERTKELAQLTEQLGYHHLWVYDHVETVPRREPTHVFEAFTTLAALAQHTSTIKLGQMVTCAAYRNAGLLAKEAALFVASGTMSNQLAIRTHLKQPPYSIVCDHRAHIYLCEAGGLAFHTGAQVIPVIPSNGKRRILCHLP